jgi:pimeloyl-ACP methyl ester carboxylesterase
MSFASMVSQWDVAIPADGLTLAGRLHVPLGLGPDDRRPGVVIAGPVPGVKEIASPLYAAALAAAGFIVLTFDYRGFGGSGGARREGGVVNEHADDLRHAIAYLAQRRDVESDRLALCAVGLGAGYACMVAAFDPRIRALAAVGGVLDFRGSVEAMLGPGAPAYLAEVTRRAEGKRPESSYVPVVGASASLVMLPGEAAYRFFDRIGRALGSQWRNRISVQLLGRLLDFQALPFLPRLAERPALFVQGSRDALCPPSSAMRLLELGAELWTLEWVWTRHHFELYEPSEASREAAATVGRWMAVILARAAAAAPGVRAARPPVAERVRSPAASS